MKKSPVYFGAAIALTLFVTGCETSGVQSRVQEKSAVFATLSPEQKKNIEGGAIEIGYSNDMVYMALGKPTKIKAQDGPEGKLEMWTYNNYIPTIAASEVSFNNPNTKYSPMMNSPNMPSHGGQPAGTGSPSLFATGGGPQGSLSLADLPVETLHVVLFKDRVIKIALEGK